MSYIEHINKSIQSESEKYLQVPDEIVCTFRFGKNDHHYIKMNHESIAELEEEEDNKQQSDNKVVSTATAADSAIMKIKSELRHLCSLQVPNFDKSSISVFNSDTLPSSPPNCTTLERSFELSTEDSSFLQDILNSTQVASTLEDDRPSKFPFEPIDQLFTLDPDMTFKELDEMPMKQNNEHSLHSEMAMSISSTTHDETTSSIESISDDNERDDINRRGLKKIGGPVRKLARFGNKQVVKYSDEYHDRRLKNNEAVKKSRLKAKEKQKETEVKMKQLADENRVLSDRVDLLMKELQVLKSLYRELNQDLPASAIKELERINAH